MNGLNWQKSLLMVLMLASMSSPASAQLREVYVPKRCVDNKPGDVHIQCISTRPVGSTNTNLPKTSLLSSFAAVMAHAATTLPDTVTNSTLENYNQLTSTLRDAGLTGPWTDKDTEVLFDVIGEAPKIGDAISFVRSTGELVA